MYSRRARLIAAIEAAIEGKYYQLQKLEDKYNDDIFAAHKESVRAEQADFRNLLEEVKEGKRI